MAIDGRGRDVSKINRHRKIRQRGQLEFKRIGKHHFAWRNDNSRRAVKCERLVRGRVDVAIAGAARTGGQGNVRGIDRDRAGSVCVGESRLQTFSADSRVNELSQRAVGQQRWRQIPRLGQLRPATPGRHPMIIRRKGVSLRANQSDQDSGGHNKFAMIASVHRNDKSGRGIVAVGELPRAISVSAVARHDREAAKHPPQASQTLQAFAQCCPTEGKGWKHRVPAVSSKKAVP